MKITVKNHSVSNNIIEIARVRLKKQSKKVIKSLIIIGAISIGFIILGISTRDDYGMVNTGKKIIYYNLNLYTSFGIAGLFMLLFLVRQLNKTKKDIMNKAQNYASKFETIDEISYEFNDSEIIIENRLHTEKINWKIFENKIYEEKFIFLCISDDYINSYVLNGNIFTGSEFSAIKEIIDKKII